MKLELPGAASLPLRRRDGGYCAEGPGFYIWDEDPHEVLRVARELAQGRAPRVPTQRLLVVPPPEPQSPKGETDERQR